MPRCLNCKDKFIPKRFLEKFCEKEECVNASVKYAIEKVRANKDKKWKAEKSVLRNELKTLGQYEADAKKSFQRYIRTRDTGLPCISCGTQNAKEIHASHYFNANLYSGLIFDERNVNASCDYCNVYLSGNLIGYRKGLVERFGKEFVEQLESESNSKRNYKYTKEELISIKKKYDSLIKKIKL